jgi:anaerobic selenocysteine-containing dehydrogenase
MTSSRTRELRVLPGSCPLDCPDACSWQVTVDASGTAVKLRGNPDHPFTQGGLCKKVNPWLVNSQDARRLTEPMRRIGPKGSGRFEPISWDDAIGEMAERLGTIRDTVGAAAIWPYYGTGNLGWVQGSNGPARVWTRMGASAHNMSICSVAGNAGMEYTVGVGDWMDAEDFAHAGLVLVWGSNTVVSNRHLWPFIETARTRGAPVVVVDPIRTRTADRADLHLQLRPGTDAALALGICAALSRTGAADPAFLQNRTIGWDEFNPSLKDWTLERTAAVTGVPEETIAKLVDLIATSAPLAVRVGHGMQRHAGGGQAMRAVSCIPAVVGAYDQRGGGSLYSGIGKAKGYNLVKSRLPEFSQRPRTLVMTNLGRNLTELNDPPVDALVIWGANPVVSNPQTNLVRQGLARTDLFTVVIDIFHTETVDWADLVLPSTMQHEHQELSDSYNHRYVHWNPPAATPAGSCLSHTEIFRRLGRAMGYDDPETQASDVQLIEDQLDTDVMREAGVTVANLERFGFVPLPDRGKPSARAFATDSGRFMFSSLAAEVAGHGRLPHHVPALEATPRSPWLALIAAAGEFHVNSTFAGTGHTLARTSAPQVVLHPLDAAERRLSAGALVRVSNERGAFEAALAISDRTQPGVVNSTKGWWGNDMNSTVDERDADMGGGAVFHDNAVLVEPVKVTTGTPETSQETREEQQ